MSLLELTVTMAVLTVGFLIYSGAVVSFNRLRTSSRESAIAAAAAQRIIETMRSEDFHSIYALYDENPLDDPAGPATAPGHRFKVDDIAPPKSVSDGCCGEIHLPGVEITPRVWQLRESQQSPELGFPRDINGDSIIDDADHAGDYMYLPLRVTVDWQSHFGPRHFEISTMIVEYRK